MKRTIMKCDCCGMEFYTEYYQGGYIDHFENFASRYGRYNNDADKLTYEICQHGNKLRDSRDIQTRMKCVLLSKDIEDSCKEQIKTNVNTVLENISKAEQKAKDIVSNLSALERLKLIEAAQYNCNNPYVGWEGCL